MNKVLRNMSIPFHSQLFIGNVRHRRFTPVKHELNYSMFMPAIDLDEIGLLEKKFGALGLAGGIGLDSNVMITSVKGV